MRHFLTVFCLLCLMNTLSLAAIGQTGEGGIEPAVANVEIGPQEDGNWKVAYTFESPQKVLAFTRSSNDYRETTWSLKTDGARFGRVAGVDVIVFDEPSTEAVFSIIPLMSPLEADYTPFVAFADGGLAIYEGQFSLVPFETLGAVEALDGDLDAATQPPLPFTVSLASQKPIIVDGRVLEGQVRHRVSGDGTYIYTGEGEIETFKAFTAVLDSALPDWLRERFDQDLDTIFSEFETLWGFGLEDKATVMLAYKGAVDDGLSAQGGALDQLLMMEVGGSALNEPDFDTLSYLHWFFAHEVIHLFQTEKGVKFSRKTDSWIHEGAANTMAYNLIASMLGETDGPKFLSGVYANAFEVCVDALEEGPLSSAAERDTFSAHYACGDFIALASDGFLKRRDLYDIWNELTDQAARMDSREVSADLYFTTLQLLGMTQAHRERIARFVSEELEDPRQALTDLLEESGLEPEFNAEGQLVSLAWPDYSPE